MSVYQPYATPEVVASGQDALTVLRAAVWCSHRAAIHAELAGHAYAKGDTEIVALEKSLRDGYEEAFKALFDQLRVYLEAQA
jgi:hypothetical protein